MSRSNASRARAGRGRTGRWRSSTRSTSASTRPRRRSRRSSRGSRAPPRPAGADPDAVRRAAEDCIRAMMLIRTYRVRGHLAAKLDPLGLTHRELPADLTPAYHGFSDADLDRQIWLGGTLGFEQASVREIVRGAAGAITAATSASNICTSTTWRSGASSRTGWRARTPTIQFTPEGKHSILAKVIHGEQWEKFLARKYVGTKRFGLDGGESAIPALEAVIKYGGADGRRGDRRRHGPPRAAQRPLQRHGQARTARSSTNSRAARPIPPTSADRATSNTTSAPRRDREFDGNKVHLSLLPNPSHLEAVDPVVLGKARAVQTLQGRHAGRHGPADPAPRRRRFRRPGRRRGMPRLLRACPATAPAARSISSSTTRSASPPARSSARSSPYPSDVAKVGPGADPPRQRRRSRSGDLLLQAGDRVPPDVQPRHRHRHVVLSPLRPQ